MDRRLMGLLAEDVESPLLDAAAGLLDPVWAGLEGLDLDTLSDVEPAVAFDPVHAAGRRRAPRPLPPPPGAAARRAPPPVTGGLTGLGAADLAGLVDAGELTAQEVLDAFAPRIAARQALLNVFISLNLESARAAARRGPRGRLAGVPLGLKDLIDVVGIPTTAGSAFLGGHVPEADAEAWCKLRDEGALLLGKLNTHEFAAGVTSENDHYGPVRNPWNLQRMAGGSSGGSAAGVAAAMMPASLGTDTGGSIRIPAAFCGVVGLKPTYGLVSRRGVCPLSWSLDHVGPFGREVRDVGLVLDVLAGTDCERAARSGAAAGLGGLRVGVPREWVESGVQAAVGASFERALGELRGLGAEIVEVQAPDPDLLVALNRAIAYTEGSAWHEAFLRQGHPYGSAVRPRMEAGRFLWATQYLNAQRMRRLLCRRFDSLWDEVDLVASPTVPAAAPPLGSREVTLGPGCREPLATALIRLTGPFNLFGLPALALPCGFDAEGLPLSLQLAAPAFSEPLLCFAGAAYEAATPHHRRRPAPIGGERSP